MSKVSLHIDTVSDTQASVVALVAAVFSGVVYPPAHAAAVQPATLHPLDNPAVGGPGDEAGDTGATATNSDGSVRFDAMGLPWDGRIHATPPSMTKKNLWRNKRGADEATIASVIAELRARFPNALPSTPAPAPAQPLPITTAQPGAHPGTLPAAAGNAAALNALPGLPGLAAPAPVAPLTPYQEFCTLISSNTAPAGKLPEDYVKSGLLSYGVPDGNIANMATMPDANIKAIHAAFVQVIAAAG